MSPNDSKVSDSVNSSTNPPEDAPKSEEILFKNLNLWAKVKFTLHTVRTEILASLFVFFFASSDPAVSSLLLERACSVNLNYSDYICKNLSAVNKTGELLQAEDDSQKVVASIGVWKGVVESAIPIVLVLFMGSWSDRHGRKLCMLYTLFGLVLMNLGLLLGVYCTSWTAEVVVLVGYLPLGAGGSMVAMLMSLVNYIIDVVSLDKRTFRVGTVTAAFLSGMSLGMSTGGPIVKKIGYIGIFAMGAVGEALCFLYVIIFIHDVERSKDDNGNICTEVIRNFVDVFRTLAMKRKNNNRIKLILMIMVIFFASWKIGGQSTVLYLFTQKKLNWNIQQFGYYHAFDLVFTVAGSFATIGIMVQKLKISDEFVGIFASVSLIASNLWFSTAYISWMMYIGSAIGFAGGAVMFVTRALPTKLVEKHETGKVNGAITVMESLSRLVGSPIYNGVYYATFDTFLGAIFILTAVAGALPLMIYTWLYVARRQETKSLSEEKDKQLETDADKRAKQRY